ncbi:hypothetical protein [Geomicrobium sp. JCM 19039]|uniref:hypothetical protein n=1 Tax=Geomicrobium sp. JCM 19039 TaxID=1460636 RepID=UPI00045F1CBC|nr:hypothetical protein [Geomicrobium sp. JCM 19039]GAK12196.1 hypothetical protein JCM19039_1939 [Geomicrobium sp. JCM 19039]
MFQPMVTDALASIKGVLQREFALVMTGVISLIFAVIAVIIIFFNGTEVPPEGNMENVFSFSAATGIFIISLAIIFPETRLNLQLRKRI